MNPWIQQQYPQWERRRRKRSFAGGTSSVVIPGLGQFFNHRPGAAVQYFFLTVSAYLLFVPLGIIAHLVCIFDAYWYGYEIDLKGSYEQPSKRILVSPSKLALLSSFVPGLGQISGGRVAAGLIWMLATCIGYVLFIVPGLVLHIICIIDALATEPVV